MKNDIPKVPRGIRNNNPLNIVQTKDKWQEHGNQLGEKKMNDKEAPQFKRVGDPEWEAYVEQCRAETRLMQQKAAVNPYVWREFEKFPTAWIARDEDGSLWLYDKEPREGGGMFHMSAGGETMMSLPPESYHEVTYELSPVKVKLLFFAV